MTPQTSLSTRVIKSDTFKWIRLSDAKQQFSVTKCKKRSLQYVNVEHGWPLGSIENFVWKENLWNFLTHDVSCQQDECFVPRTQEAGIWSSG